MMQINCDFLVDFQFIYLFFFCLSLLISFIYLRVLDNAVSSLWDAQIQVAVTREVLFVYTYNTQLE